MPCLGVNLHLQLKNATTRSQKTRFSQIWLKKCRRSDGVNPSNTVRMCSLYFSYSLKYAVFILVKTVSNGHVCNQPTIVVGWLTTNCIVLHTGLSCVLDYHVGWTIVCAGLSCGLDYRVCWTIECAGLSCVLDYRVCWTIV